MSSLAHEISLVIGLWLGLWGR